MVAERTAALSESQQRQGLIQSAMDAIIATDASQRIVLFNPAAERMFGCRNSEALGSSIDRFIPEQFAPPSTPEPCGRVWRNWRDIPSIGLAPFGVGPAPRMARSLPIEASISRLHAGGERLFTVIMRNVTERKRLEEHTRLLMGEVNHHADVLSRGAVHRAADGCDKSRASFGHFGERIQALSASQDLLVQNEWKGVDIASLVQSQLAHFQELIGTRIALKGPSFLIYRGRRPDHRHGPA